MTLTPLLAHAELTGLAATTVALVALCALASRGAERLARPVRRQRLVLLALATATVIVAVSPTVEHLAHEKLSWHMTQHLLLTVVAPPLFVLARTGRTVTAGLPKGVRGAVAPLHRTAARTAHRRRGELAVAAAVVAVVATWVWHVPAAYDAALDQSVLHALEHATFFATALVFWAAALDRRTPVPAALVGILVFAIGCGALGAMLTFAPRPLFDSYANGAGALADQQLAGLLMWIPGGAPALLVAVAVTVRALSRSFDHGPVDDPRDDLTVMSGATS